MKQLRWPTTLVLLCLAAALISIVVLVPTAPRLGFGIAILAVLLLLVATLFGKRGV